MAKVLFAGHPLGLIVLPIMLFHQIQLMTCAVLARRYAVRREGVGAHPVGDAVRDNATGPAR
jgi:solute carrier family 10 (sodium/bile acid cotransporter), member 7